MEDTSKSDKRLHESGNQDFRQDSLLWLIGGTRGAQKLVVFIGAIVAIYLLFTTFKTLTLTVLIAALLAYILEPIVDNIENQGVKRWTATAIVFVIVCLALILILLLVAPIAASQIIYFTNQAPDYVKKLLDYLNEFYNRIDSELKYDWPSFAELLRNKVQDNIPAVAQRVSQIFTIAFRSTMSVISTFLLLVLAPIISFYLLLSAKSLKESAIDLIPPHLREPVLEKIEVFDQVLAGFIRGQLIVCLILACLYSIGFLIIGIDMAIPVGVIGGLLFFIPYLGTTIAGILATLLALVKFGDIWHPFYVVAWISVIQFLEGYFITPKIVGDAVGLHPVLYIIAIIAGAQLMGLLGMLVAVPVAAMLKTLAQTAFDYYRNSEFYNGPSQSA